MWSSFKRSEKAYQKKVKSERERSMFSAGQRMYRSLAGTCRRGWWSLQGGDKSESKKPTSEVKERSTDQVLEVPECGRYPEDEADAVRLVF